MIEFICYALIWVAYSSLLFLHLSHVVHGVFGPPAPPPVLSAPPSVGGGAPG